MRRVAKGTFFAASIAAVVLAVGGCPGGGGLPDKPGVPGKSAGTVNPDGCGGYAASEAGRKIKAFLEATVALNDAVMETEATMKSACVDAGAKLGMADLDGSTKDVCNKVIEGIKANLQVGLKAEANLDVQYEPAVCEVNVEAAASAAAKCEAKAEADIAVTCQGECSGTCEGSCSGTCQGACEGTCEGGAAAGGDGAAAGGDCNGTCSGTCKGECSGTCQGSCTGGCEGHADVNASAECEAKAEVSASVDAKCTEPKLEVNYDAAMVVDASKVEAAVAAIQAGMPRLLMVGAKVQGPLKAAFVTWSKTASELGGAARDVASAFKDQAMCVAGQLSAAAAMVAQIEVSIEVQVEVSASASGSVGGGA